MPNETRYQFTWDLLGDIALGRPNLGQMTRLEVYRLMQFTFRDVLEKHYGTVEADKIFYEAGHLSGIEFFRHTLPEGMDFELFIQKLEEVLREMKIGLLRLEKADLETGQFILTVSEDLDCSGLPELDFEICVYDEGFISGVLEGYTGFKYKVNEIDCWCTGDRTCRFQVEMIRG